MNGTRFIRSGLLAALAVFLVSAIAFSQGKVKNKGTWNNAAGSTLRAGTFQNYNVTPGTLNNAGMVSVSTLFDNNLAGATVHDSISTDYGTIWLNVAANYGNGAGTTFNSSGTIRVGSGSLTTGAGAIDTKWGTIAYNGSGTIYVNAVSGAEYGTLRIDSTGSNALRSLEAGLKVHAVELNGGTAETDSSLLELSGYKLTVLGSGFTVAGRYAVRASSNANSEVDYAANTSQTVFPTSYSKLTLSGTTGSNTKTANGDLSVQGTLTVSGNDILDVAGGSSFTLADNSTLNNQGTVKASGDVAIGSPITVTNAGSFTYYSTTVDQVVGALAYQNLTFTGATKRTFAGNTSVSGSYTVTGHTGTRDYRTNSTTFNYAGSGQTVAGDNYYVLGFTGSGTSTLGGTSAAEAKTVTVASTATLQLSGASALTVGYAANDGSMTNDGTVTVGSGTTLNIGQAGGSIFGAFTNNLFLNNSGNLNVYGNGTASYYLTNASDGTLTNSSTGVVTVASADLNNDGAITNSGTITVQ